MGTIRLMRRLALVSLAVLLAFAASAAAESVLFQGAYGGVHERPRFVALSVDGTLEASTVSWAKWGGPVAVGNGRIEWHGCNPACGVTSQHHASGSVHLSQIHYCSEGAYYSKVSVYIRVHGKLRLLRGVTVNYAPC